MKGHTPGGAAMNVGAVILVVAIALAATGAYLYRRGRSGAAGTAPKSSVEARLDAFWTWWKGAAPRLAAVTDAGQAPTLAEEIGARVDAIDPRLAWETGPALEGARHHLALSAEGDLELRVLTERWASRAPPPDGVWEFYPARQASPRADTNRLELADTGGVKVDAALTKVAFEFDDDRELVNVRFHNPEFAKLEERHHALVAYLTLDDLLGEDGVERWIGRIEPSSEPVADGKPLGDLRKAVEGLAKRATGERFAVLRRQVAPGRPMFAAVNLALKRVDHLLMDTLLTVTIPLRDPTPEGLTTREEGDALNSAEDALQEVLGHDAVYIGHDTGEGRRAIYFHVAGFGPAEARTQEWARSRMQGRPEITLSYEPGWESLARWR